MFLLLDDAAIAWLMPKSENQHRAAVTPGRQTMEEQCLDWLQTTRKKSVSLGVSTHSLEKVFESPIGRILVEGCQLRFFMPNPSAMVPLIRRTYEDIGLTDTAIHTIASAMPQRQVYLTHAELGQRLLDIPHGPLALDCLARNDEDDHALMDELLTQEGREGFSEAWFRRHNHHDAARQVAAWRVGEHATAEREHHEADLALRGAE